MGWMVGGLNPRGFFASVQIRHWAKPASRTSGVESFTGLKPPERYVDRLPPSNTEVKERVVL